jgi:NADPH-dependent 2,4-dienoyl-CoA reductase/sulfur reductase-like enzyme
MRHRVPGPGWLLGSPNPSLSPPVTASPAPTWDVIVIGSGIGGLVTASQLAAKGAKTLVLERLM